MVLVCTPRVSSTDLHGPRERVHRLLGTQKQPVVVVVVDELKLVRPALHELLEELLVEELKRLVFEVASNEGKCRRAFFEGLPPGTPACERWLSDAPREGSP